MTRMHNETDRKPRRSAEQESLAEQRKLPPAEDRWFWQATPHNVCCISGDRAAKLAMAGETVWPTGFRPWRGEMVGAAE